MNEQQAEFAKLKQDLLQSRVDKLEAGKETIETLTLVYEAKRELLDKIYKEIQSM
jgi:hypothetical protein